MAINLGGFFGGIGNAFNQAVSGVEKGVGQIGNDITSFLGPKPNPATTVRLAQQVNRPAPQPAPQTYTPPVNRAATPRYYPQMDTGGARPAMPNVNNYVQNQIVNPFQQGTQNLFNNPSLMGKALGGMQTFQGVMNTLPAGIGYNLTRGPIAGAINANRTNTPLPQAITQGITQNSSIGHALTNNPLLAMGIDVFSGNPKAVAEGAITQNLPTALTELQPRDIIGRFANAKSMPIHPMDVADVSPALERVLQADPADANYAVTQLPQDHALIAQIAEHYMPGVVKTLGNNTMDIARALLQAIMVDRTGIPK